MKITVYWSEIVHYNADIEVPDGLSEEEVTKHIHENFTKVCWPKLVCIGEEIEYNSIEWNEIT